MAPKHKQILLLLSLFLVATTAAYVPPPPAAPKTYKQPVPATPKPPAPLNPYSPPAKRPYTPPPVVVKPPVKRPYTPPPIVVKPPTAPYPPMAKPPPPIPFYGQGPPVKKEDCRPLCQKRCARHYKNSVCVRSCSTCCARCKCVPPGPYAKKEVCGLCYTNMTTHGGRPKCP